MTGSLRRRYTLTVVGILAAVIGLMLIAGVLLLRPYYMSHKRGVVRDGYARLNAICSNTSLEESARQEQMREVLQSLFETENISSVVVTGNSVTAQVSFAANAEAMLGRLLAYERMTFLGQRYPEGTEVIDSSESYQMLETPQQGNASARLECWGTLGSGAFFLLSAPLESMMESASVSSRFFMAVGFAGIVLGALLAYFQGRRMSQPITQLSRLSEKVADLDFSERYEGRERDEIGVLGNNMNRMADALQETVTELRSANEELRRDLEKRTQMDDMRKDFLNSVSHELKTPLALISGYAEGLSDGINDDPESRAYYCGVIMDEADKMNRMVRKLLTLNDLEFGNEGPEMDRFDLVSMIRSILQTTEVLNPEVRVLFREVDPVWVVADEFQMEEVVTNYLTNAYAHAEGDKIITVQIERRDGVARVTVYNTGAPIPEEDLPKIWDKFYKVDKARTRSYGGSGIGLSIVKAVMEAHRQAYGAENREGGVAFWFEAALAQTE